MTPPVAVPRNILSSQADFRAHCLSLQGQGKLPLPPFHALSVTDISGNINRVRRVAWRNQTDQPVFSVIVKAVPEKGRLEKYPDIYFPEERLTYEAEYNRLSEEAARTYPELQHWPPLLYDADLPNQILVLADLAPAKPLEQLILEGAKIAPDDLARLGSQLALFHRWSAESRARHPEMPECNPSAMANHPYIFTLPVSQPERMRALWPQNPDAFVRESLQERFLSTYGHLLLPIADTLEKRFLTDTPQALIHGDLHGGSLFLSTSHQWTVIDAELAMWGACWFDVGTVLAHVILLSEAVPCSLSPRAFLKGYFSRTDASQAETLLTTSLQMAGFEIIRRLIGAANVPYLTEPHPLERLLSDAANWILTPRQTALFQEVVS